MSPRPRPPPLTPRSGVYVMICHATYSLTVTLLNVTGAHGQATTTRFFEEWADISPSLLLHSQPLRGVRVTMPRDLMYPLPLKRRGCPQSYSYRGASASPFKMQSFQRRCLRYPPPSSQAQPPALFQLPCPPVTRTCLCRVPCYHT